jgi:hypothetical protein
MKMKGQDLKRFLKLSLRRTHQLAVAKQVEKTPQRAI